MKTTPNKHAWQQGFNRISEQANREFVGWAKSLLHLVTWPRAAAAPSRSSDDKNASISPETKSSHRRSKRQRQFQARLNELFHHEEVRRLGAVKWFRKMKAVEAIPVLQAMGAVEENSEIRREIAQTIEQIQPTFPKIED